MANSINYKNYPNFQPSKWNLLNAVWRWVTSKFYPVVITNKNAKLSERNIDVLFIHGAFDREGGFKVMTDQLANRLPQNISSMHRLSFQKRYRLLGIKDYAQQIINYAEKNHLKELILVGHSRGGAIAAYADYLMQTKKKDTQIHAVILLGSPLLGIKIEFPLFRYIYSIDEMKVNSQFLVELNQSLDVNDEKYYYIGAENDGIVSHQSACRDYKSQHHVVLKGENHLSLLVSPAAIKTVNDILHEFALKAL